MSTQAPTFTVAWHPKKYLLAYACDDKVCMLFSASQPPSFSTTRLCLFVIALISSGTQDKYDRDTGGVWLFGLTNS